MNFSLSQYTRRIPPDAYKINKLQSRNANRGQLHSDVSPDRSDPHHRNFGIGQPLAGYQLRLALETVL